MEELFKFKNPYNWMVHGKKVCKTSEINCTSSSSVKGSSHFNNNRFWICFRKSSNRKPKSSTGSFYDHSVPLFPFFPSCIPCFTTVQTSNIGLIRQWITMLHTISNISVWFGFAEFANWQDFPKLQKISDLPYFLICGENLPHIDW